MSETSQQSKAVLSLYIAALLAGNLIPVLGVLLWKWDTFLLLFVFWIETGLIGGFTALKIVLALPDYRPRTGHFVTYRQAAHGLTRSFTAAEVPRLWILPAFVLGYAAAMIFTAVLGVTLLRLDADLAMLWHHASAIGLAIGLLLVDQRIAFWRDYFGGPEWARSDPVFHMWCPFGRFVLFYFLLSVGGPLAMATGKSAILAVFVFFDQPLKFPKTLRAHVSRMNHIFDSNTMFRCCYQRHPGSTGVNTDTSETRPKGTGPAIAGMKLNWEWSKPVFFTPKG